MRSVSVIFAQFDPADPMRGAQIRTRCDVAVHKPKSTLGW